jgi:two-component system, LytTR family, response regulator
MDNNNPIKATLVIRNRYVAEQIEHFFAENDYGIHICDMSEDMVEEIINMNRYKPDIVFLHIDSQDDKAICLPDCFPETNIQFVYLVSKSSKQVTGQLPGMTEVIELPLTKKKMTAFVNRYKKNRVYRKQPLVISTHIKKYVVRPEDIVFIKASNNYSEIVRHENSAIVASRTLKHFEQCLSCHHFMRANRSYLINPKYILQREVTAKGHIILTGNHTVKITERYKEQFFNALQQW